MVKIRYFPSAHHKVILSFVCFTFLIIVSGCQTCTTTVHAYDGEFLLGDQTARVTYEERERTGWDKLLSTHPSLIVIVTVDNKNFRDYVEGCIHIPKEIFVLPGPHSFGIRFRGPGGAQAGLIPALIAESAFEMKYGPLGTELEFNTEAGHEYKIRFKEKTEPWKGITSVKYWVEDVDSGEIVFGEKPPDLEPDEGS